MLGLKNGVPVVAVDPVAGGTSSPGYTPGTTCGTMEPFTVVEPAAEPLSPMAAARLGHETRDVIGMTQAKDRISGQVPPAVVVSLPDEIDMSNHRQAGEQLAAALRAGHPVVVADLSQTVFCDSAGIRVLCRAHQDAASRGAELRFVIPHPGVQRVIQITGADQILHIYPTRKAPTRLTPPPVSTAAAPSHPAAWASCPPAPAWPRTDPSLPTLG